MSKQIVVKRKDYFLAYRGIGDAAFKAVRKISRELKKKRVDNKIFYIDDYTIALGVDVRYKHNALELIQDACKAL